MNKATVQLILALLPMAEKLAVTIGGKVMELNTTNITSKEDLIAFVKEMKAEDFPDYKFISGKPPADD